MTIKGDTSTSSNSIAVAGITSPVTTDVQAVELVTIAGTTATEVTTGNPLPVNVATSVAASRITDSVSSGDASDAIMIGLTALTPQFAKIVASSSGTTSIVTGSAGKVIRVLKWDLVCSGAVTVKWQTSTGPTDITGGYPFAANGGIQSGYCKLGHFQTNSSDGLSINLGTAVAVGGSLVYVYV